MSELLLCQHCGNKTSQTLIGKGQESEAIILEDGQEFDLDWFIWFVQCNNCEKYSLFACLDDIAEEATSIWPKEKQVDNICSK